MIWGSEMRSKSIGSQAHYLSADSRASCSQVALDIFGAEGEPMIGAKRRRG